MQSLRLALALALFAKFCAPVHASPSHVAIIIVRDSRQPGQNAVALAGRTEMEAMRTDAGLADADLPIEDYDLHQKQQAAVAHSLRLDQARLPVVAVCAVANDEPTSVTRAFGSDDRPFDSACVEAMAYAGRSLGLTFGYLGVRASPLTLDLRTRMHIPSGARGVFVTSVAPASPAAVAGVQAGDVLESLGGVPVVSPAGMASVVYRHGVGDSLMTTLLRAGQQQTLSVTLGELHTP